MGDAKPPCDTESGYGHRESFFSRKDAERACPALSVLLHFHHRSGFAGRAHAQKWCGASYRPVGAAIEARASESSPTEPARHKFVSQTPPADFQRVRSCLTNRGPALDSRRSVASVDDARWPSHRRAAHDRESIVARHRREAERRRSACDYRRDLEDRAAHALEPSTLRYGSWEYCGADRRRREPDPVFARGGESTYNKGLSMAPTEETGGGSISRRCRREYRAIEVLRGPHSELLGSDARRRHHKIFSTRPETGGPQTLDRRTGKLHTKHVDGGAGARAAASILLWALAENDNRDRHQPRPKRAGSVRAGEVGASARCSAAASSAARRPWGLGVRPTRHGCICPTETAAPSGMEPATRIQHHPQASYSIAGITLDEWSLIAVHATIRELGRRSVFDFCTNGTSCDGTIMNIAPTRSRRNQTVDCRVGVTSRGGVTNHRSQPSHSGGCNKSGTSAVQAAPAACADRGIHPLSKTTAASGSTLRNACVSWLGSPGRDERGRHEMRGASTRHQGPAVHPVTDLRRAPRIRI